MATKCDQSDSLEFEMMLESEEREEESAIQPISDINEVVDIERVSSLEFKNTQFVGCHSCGEERIWSTVLSIMVASIPALLFGCTLGFPSPVLFDLMELDRQELRFDTLLSDLFSALGLVGGIVGGPPAGWVADKWGRKISVAVNGVLYGTGYTLIAFAKVQTLSPQTFKGLLMVGRFITGIGCGWSFVSTPVYSAEISSPRLRGMLTSFAELALVAGIFLVYVLGSVNGFTYFEISLVMLGIVFVFFVTVPWIPETPRWLLFRRKDREKALKVLLFLRGSKYHTLHSELEGIELAIKSLGSLSITQTLKEFKKQTILIPFLVLLVLMMFQELCGGGSTVTTYAASIFKQAGVENPLLLSSFAIGGSQLFATVVSVCIIDCVGRKMLLICSFFGMFVGSTMLGVHFYITRPSLCEGISTINMSSYFFEDPTVICNDQFAPLAIVSIIFFIMSFAIGVGPVLWTLIPEYFPLHVRGLASGVVILANWATAVTVTGLYLSYANLVKPWFAWWTFSIINCAGMVFVIIFVVETKGKSLEDIQETLISRFHFCHQRTNKYCTVSKHRITLDDSEDLLVNNSD